MLWAALLFLVSVMVLWWSADRFVLASVAMAKRWHWPPLVVGVVLVGFGTSFPEWVVSLSASLNGQASMAAANVVGSNIANLALIGGLACVFFPMSIARRVWTHDLPTFLLLSAVVIVSCWYLGFGVKAAWVMLALLCVVLFDALRVAKKDPHPPEAGDALAGFGVSLMWWVIGLAVLFASAEGLVRSASFLAHQWGWSEWLIGLTVVTLGTSLPELAATLASAKRGHNDVAIGHLIGSNLFNTTAVLAMPALFGHRPFLIFPLSYNWLIMMGMTVLFWVLLMVTRKKTHCPHWVGYVLLLAYAGYLWWIF